MALSAPRSSVPTSTKKSRTPRRSPRRDSQRRASDSPRTPDGPVGERTEQDLEQQRYDALRRLALAAEPEESVSEHLGRVALTSQALATQLGLSQPDAALIHDAAPLHDLGMIAIPGSVLLTAGPLSAIEFEQVKTHTIAGAGLLTFSSFSLVRLAREIALTHHERWDGSGYPRGLRGEEIPLSGRIVAIADAFDALTHDRPYKNAWTIDRAAAELQELRGSQFDPAVVDAFLKLDPATLVESTPPPSLGVAATVR